ncbi:MAG: DUF4417 domain-containing protein [Bacteroidia bacterium]|nr:DUF4417 domain-containing protein [Bacteroidia bacterium]
METLHKQTRKTDLNLELIPDRLSGKYDIPDISSGYSQPPGNMLPFNMAKSCRDADSAVHFFVDDYQFERVWRSPARYAELLRPFRCVLSPDFSLYTDMPLAMKIWNVYRSRLIGSFWQKQGLNVIPTLQWAEPRTFDFCFSGIEPGGMVAVSTLGAAKHRVSKCFWQAGMSEAVKRLHPKTILVYGEPISFDFDDIDVFFYSNQTIKRLRHYGR